MRTLFIYPLTLHNEVLKMREAKCVEAAVRFEVTDQIPVQLISYMAYIKDKNITHR